MAECESCAASVWLTDDEISAMFGKTVLVKNIKTVTEEEYNRRMSICRECDCLLYGTTCRHCGCIVNIKAKLQAAKCPYPFNPKW